MATLSKSDRDNLPDSKFAGPHRSFPLTDKNHDRATIQDVPKAEHAGSITKSEGDKITAEARAKLHGGAGDPPADHKAAVAKMHPEHVHKLVEDAHAGKYGPEAQQHAKAAMAEGQNDNDADDSAPSAARDIFGRGSDVNDNDADDEPQGPTDARSIFGR